MDAVGVLLQQWKVIKRVFFFSAMSNNFLQLREFFTARSVADDFIYFNTITWLSQL